MPTDFASATVHVLKVSLVRVRPAVWRRLEVPSTITLGELDVVLQAAFGWEGGHLHQFEVRDTLYGPAELRGDVFGAGPWHSRVLDEDLADLDRLLPRPGEVAEYTYDLGDDWRHRIQVEEVQVAQPDLVYPVCAGGSGLAPKEGAERVRRGRFGEREQQELNDLLVRFGAVPGRDLPVREPSPNDVFAGLFPEIDASAAGQGCLCEGCEECEEADETDETDEGDAGQMPLPVLWPEPDDVLAAAAEASPLVRRAVALAGWLGSGRSLTPSRVLRPGEAAQAVTSLGLDRPVLPSAVDGAGRSVAGAVSPPGPGIASGLRSAKDAPALHAVWSAAVSAGLIEVRGQKAYPGPELVVWREPAEPRDRLASWARLLAGYLQVRGTAARTERSLLTLFHGPLLPVSVLMLYTSAKAPLWAGLLGFGGLAVAEDEDDPTGFLELPAIVEDWAAVLEDWAVTGVVAAAAEQDVDALAGPDPGAAAGMLSQLQGVLGDLNTLEPVMGRLFAPVVQAARRGPVVEVTPFGRYALARVLRAHGRDVLTIGHLAGVPASDLLLALGRCDPRDAMEEVRRWLDARGEGWQEALDHVVRSASTEGDEGPALRSVLPVVVCVAAVAAGEMLDEWQRDPWLAASVAIGRHAAGQGPEPSLAHLLWTVVDVLSLGLDDEEAFTQLMDSTHAAQMLAAPGGPATAAALEHPRTREVLRMLAADLDDPDLAHELRRAMAESRRDRRAKRR